ncbi:hypothetical protein [Nocardioides sp. URHA0020]|uniref:hypothetical protein n=1 Tax=Nocardioides sp. URHA0020 TaxID=1380392 RepID=UPI00048F3B66|nr:hypothetical protein [Nocardioides sp. URHA0020]
MTEPDPTRDDTAVVERFAPTSGRLTGVLGLVTAGVVFAIAVFDWDTGTPLGVAIVALLGALLVWMALLRPALWATHQYLAMRGITRTEWIPLVAIERVVITQMLAIGTGDKRYLSPVIGHTARTAVKGRFGASAPKVEYSHQQLVETRINQLAREARERHDPDPGVRRTWAWPELAGCALLVLAFAVWLVAS